MSRGFPPLPTMIDLAGGGAGMKLRTDDYSEVVLDADGQGFVRVNDLRTHSMWACCMCGIPTGGSERRCQTHPDSNVFLKSIRERSPGDVCATASKAQPST